MPRTLDRRTRSVSSTRLLHADEGGRKKGFFGSRLLSTFERRTGGHRNESRRPAPKPYSLTPPSPGRNIQPRYRGVRRCWASLLLSNDTRALIPAQSHPRERASGPWLLKCHGLQKASWGRTNSYEADNPFQPCPVPDTKGSSQHIERSRVQRSNPSRPLKWNFQPSPPAHIILFICRAGSDREAGWFGREGPEIPFLSPLL